MVCIISRTGRIAFSALADFDITTPIGMHTDIHIIVHTVIIATVAMQSFHIPKYPISINAIELPTTSFQLLEPNQANIPITKIIIGQGVVNNNFSNHTKKNNNGSKKFSIASPYFRENNLKLKSIPFLSSIRGTRSITGNLVKNSILFYQINNEPI